MKQKANITKIFINNNNKMNKISKLSLFYAFLFPIPSGVLLSMINLYLAIFIPVSIFLFFILISFYLTCMYDYVLIKGNMLMQKGFSFLGKKNREKALNINIAEIILINYEIIPKKYTNEVKNLNEIKQGEVGLYLNEISILNLIIADTNNNISKINLNHYKMQSVELILKSIIDQMKYLENQNYKNINIKKIMKEIEENKDNPLYKL